MGNFQINATDKAKAIAQAAGAVPGLAKLYSFIVALANFYDNSSSGLSATDQDSAIDEIAGNVGIEATGTISNAELQAINATPKELIAAPGAGKIVVVEEIELFHDFDTAAFDSGAGNIVVEYGTSGSDIATLSDDFMDNVSADAYAIGKPANTLADITSSVNNNVELTTATADFAVTGGAAGVLKYRILYRVVTLQE